MAYVRTVKTASGARAVQIVHSQRRGSRDIEHIGSAHTDADLELLKAVARQRLAAGQGELELRLPGSPANQGEALPIISSRMGHLLDALGRGYDVLGFAAATGRDEVFKALVLARIIEPTSKLDSLRVLAEAGMDPPSYRTVKRRPRIYAGAGQNPDDAARDADDSEPGHVDPAGGRWRARLARACAEHVSLGPTTLLLYDVTTLYFETDEGDGFRKPGFSKERRLEPQITVGLLTDGSGFPLMVHAFEGNRAETTTMLPVLRAFLDAHHLPDVTVIADAGMVSEANKRAIEAAGLSFILGARVPDVPYAVTEWRDAHPDTEIPDGHVFVQPWPAGPGDKRRNHTIFYQYRADRARRTLRGIDTQVAKAENAVAGKTAVKRNRYVRLTGATKTVNRTLEAKNRALAGIKGYITNLPNPQPEQVIGAYSRLLQVEKSFRMSKTDLAARPIYHHTRESIEAHPTIVFAALALSRWIENTTGWSIKRFVTTARRYRTIQIQAGEHTITAADPLPDDLHAALDAIHGTH
ncbi:IS1634 family transposase [Micromonospora zingiberis]|uniref:IS1634 family transposase n=1 Tax=Micromonospora zingiberis TaxID=2053011 RepID=A0A4V2LVX8_9ACTN|nr:IS1634 family transposase [Micromonospora zingiberis]